MNYLYVKKEEDGMFLILFLKISDKQQLFSSTFQILIDYEAAMLIELKLFNVL